MRFHGEVLRMPWILRLRTKNEDTSCHLSVSHHGKVKVGPFRFSISNHDSASVVNTIHVGTKVTYQVFFRVLIDLIVELLGLIIKPLIIRQRTEIQYPNDLIIKSFDTIIW